MKRRSFIKQSILLSSIAVIPYSKSFANATDDEVFESIINKALENGIQEAPIGDILVFVAREFLGKPYKGGTLEKKGAESCVINFSAFDCVTFYELSLAIARLIRLTNCSNPALQDLIDELTIIRYRSGVLDGYTSRLHYTSYWIIDNIAKGIVEDVSAKIDSKTCESPNVFFMSSNPQYYPKLKDNFENIQKITEFERLTNLKKICYIPSKHIKAAFPMMKNGDIAAIKTNKTGLDYSHTGIILKESNGKPLFMHASSSKKEVIIDKDIATYCSTAKNCTGISIVRPI